MEFELRIIFTGMCVFVPDKKNERMVVLMPPVKMHNHESWLYYHAEHSRPIGINPKKWMRKSMGQRRIVIPSLKVPADLDLTLCPTIARLSKYSQLRVRRSSRMRKHPKTKHIMSQVWLGSGKITKCDELASWDVDNPATGGVDKVCLASEITWTVTGIPGSEFVFDFEALPIGLAQNLTLYPIMDPATQKRHITVHIVHVSDKSLPPRSSKEILEPGQNAPHFSHFYDLFGIGQSERDHPVPRFNYKLVTPPNHVHYPCNEWPGISAEDLRSNAYTCMVGGACACPGDDSNKTVEQDVDALLARAAALINTVQTLDDEEPCEEPTGEECEEPTAQQAATRSHVRSRRAQSVKSRPRNRRR